ncbi:MAG: DNA gyrase inhibitor YacG [Alphaproteobacteria bacterium]
MEPKATATGNKPRKARARCPICARPASVRFAPFCSRHCADVDLGRWLGGAYRIPGREHDKAVPDEDGETD